MTPTSSDMLRYRDLADWHEDDWRRLDILRWIYVNCNRYTRHTVARIGLHHLPPDIQDWLPGLCCDVGFKPLTSVHQRHLHETGQRRNQVMLGTLKMIAITRLVEAIIETFPMHASLDELQEAGDAHRPRTDGVLDELQPLTVEDRLDGPDDEDRHRLEMVEWVRPHLTPAQYRLLHRLVCEGRDFEQLAESGGTSLTNVRVLMLHARERLLNLMPTDMALQNARWRHRAG